MVKVVQCEHRLTVPYDVIAHVSVVTNIWHLKKGTFPITIEKIKTMI